MSTDPATLALPTRSLHDALPISDRPEAAEPGGEPHSHEDLQPTPGAPSPTGESSPSEFSDMDITSVYVRRRRDRKSTRLNSSHVSISYAVFCLKKNNLTEVMRRV